jgi:hypothetical protein
VLRTLEDRPAAGAGALSALLAAVSMTGRGRLERARLGGTVRPVELRCPVIGRWIEQQQGTDEVERAVHGAEAERGVEAAPEHVFVR